MRSYLVCLAVAASTGLYAQQKQITGTYSNQLSGVEINLADDHSFVYKSRFENPVFYRYEPLFESGHYAISGDTLILNPGLAPRPFVETEFKQENIACDSVTLTFNHIRRYFDGEGKLILADTSQDFTVTDPGANQFILNVYSNYYEDGQIRQMKMLIRNEKYIYTNQRKDGSFEGDSVWNNAEKKLKKQNQK